VAGQGSRQKEGLGKMHVMLQEKGGGAATWAQWWESSKVRKDRICRVNLL
jgi:hypothetical protein